MAQSRNLIFNTDVGLNNWHTRTKVEVDTVTLFLIYHNLLQIM